MAIDRLLAQWRLDSCIANSLVVWHEIPAQSARKLAFPDELHPALSHGLRQLGIDALYTHQATSLNIIQNGQSLVVVTGTASGKTLCYNIPIVDFLLKDEKARALFLFPTKALTQDQAAGMNLLLRALGTSDSDSCQLNMAIYDGDTSANIRQEIRNSTRMVFSNPDMLHLGILPHHTRWADFFTHLQFVVIDEAHVYRGVFGSHVANVIRRLKRIAHFYGSQPLFLLTSATIANPEELAVSLTEAEVELVSDDGAAHGPKSFLIYNPPIIDPELGLRRSHLQETVHLAETLFFEDVQTIIFGRSRRSVELILSYLREKLPISAPDLTTKSVTIGNPILSQSSDAIRGYRSGYLSETRREIERGLREGSIRTVVATNALELGIDIGGMGAALLVGYPGTIAATWQQAGRAGRSSEHSVAVLVASADPLDQFLAAHPEYFFGRSPEQALIDPDNPLILLDHLRCAAFELPFSINETYGRLKLQDLQDYLSFLSDQGSLHKSGSKYFWMADQYPAQTISLRSTDSRPVLLQVEQNESTFTIGQIDRTSALWLTHPNAIYLHEAETYLVENLDLDNNLAQLRQIDSDYYTLPRRETTVGLVELHQKEEIRGGLKSQGEVLVTSKVTGYKKMRWQTQELLGVESLDLPSHELLTTGYWLSLSDQTVTQLKDDGLWSNEPNDYGPNWDAQRDRARRRDYFRCQVCGTPEGDRAHHVHHKTPFRLFTTFAQANVLENLITLCPDCHRKVETVVRVRSGLAGLAFVLGNISPFFLMCDASDIGVHSDPQLGLAEGRPGVVLYDQIPAGLGFSQRLYMMHSELIQRAFELVVACPCSDGCPSCVGPGGELGAGGKPETLALLGSL